MSGPPAPPKPLQLSRSPVRREESAHRGESQAQDSNPALILLCPALGGPCISNRGRKKGLGEGPVTLRHMAIPTAISHLIWLLNLLGVLEKKDEGPCLCPGQPAADAGARVATCGGAERPNRRNSPRPAPPRGGQGHGRGMGRALPSAPTQDTRNRRYLGKPSPPSPECLRYGCYLILTYTW